MKGSKTGYLVILLTTLAGVDVIPGALGNEETLDRFLD